MNDNCARETLSKYVGRYLKDELKKQGRTQEAFAEELYISDRTVRRWISNGIDSLENVDLIARALHVSLGDIFSDWEDIPYPLIFTGGAYDCLYNDITNKRGFI